jgi:phage tail-like protein
MALPELDTSVGHSFGAEYDGVTIAAIQEVSGVKMEQDVIELKQNTPEGKYMIKKLPGRRKAGEVTLTRGLTAENSFDKWIEASHFGKMGEARKNGAVIVFDYEGNPIKRYVMTNCWPKTLEIGSLKAGDTSVLTEKLTIVYEEMTVEGG